MAKTINTREWSMKDSIVINLRLEKIMYDFLREQAKINERTLGAEIRFRLKLDPNSRDKILI